MKRIKIGILGTSDIAFRRFLPALQKSDYFEYIGVASRDLSKTVSFTKAFGGKGYGSYEELVGNREVEALYIPLPPALHHEWAVRALSLGKHVMLEKPFTTELAHTEEIIRMARLKELAVHENYMFLYHSQLKRIKEVIEAGDLGDVRLYRMAFGFPMRAASDFRYKKELGGGALLDCGGYTVRLAADLLGSTAAVKASKLNFVSDFDVDLYGSATLENDDGQVAQLSFGMDNSYKCELEVWGSKGTLLATRIFTAGEGFEPEITIKTGDGSKTVKLKSDDSFLNSINQFSRCIISSAEREKSLGQIIKQGALVQNIMGVAADEGDRAGA